MKNTVLIYGADDPWTSCHVILSSTSENILMINPATKHTTQIKDLGEIDKKEVSLKLDKWLESNFKVN